MKAGWTSYCEFFMFLGTVPLSFGDGSEKLIAHNEFFRTVPGDSFAVDQIQKAF